MRDGRDRRSPDGIFRCDRAGHSCNRHGFNASAHGAQIAGRGRCSEPIFRSDRPEVTPSVRSLDILPTTRESLPDQANADELEVVRRRYDRIAAVYDPLEWMMELRFRRWRRLLWARVGPGRVLELGVGTGKNIPYYPEGADVVAVDISEKMLAEARRRASSLDHDVRLELADAQALPYPDDSFDTVVGTFVFCSIPEPELALAEARRVLRPGGRLLLLEHVLSKNPILRRLMRWFDPIPYWIWGAHINRDTVTTVQRGGFVDVRAQPRSLDFVVEIGATREELS